MIRNVILVAAGFALAAGCENRAEREQIQAEKTQQSAADKSNQAQREANEKIAKAQSEATEQQQKAQDTLIKERNDIRGSAQKDLDKLDKKMSDLRERPPAAKAKGVDLAMLRSDAEAKRDAVKADLQRLDNATAMNVEEVKAAIDRDLDALKKSVEDWSDKTSSKGKMGAPVTPDKNKSTGTHYDTTDKTSKP